MGLNIRERINLAIYDSREGVLQALRRISFVVSPLALGVMIYFHGFDISEQTKVVLLNVIKAIFAFYVLRFTCRMIYAIPLTAFIKKNWFEGVLMLIIVSEGLSDMFFHQLITEFILATLGLLGSVEIASLFIQAILMFIIAMEIGRSTDILPTFKVHPAQLFLLSFVLIILTGTLLLMLPEATVNQGGMSFVNALFTSTSAVTTTGLIVEDTATYFTFKGQVIIMALIQIGSLNVIAFGVFFSLFSKFGIGMKQHEAIEDFFGGQDSQFTAKGMLGKIILWSLVIEAVGAILIYPVWTYDTHFNSYGEKVLSSVFHSISAFNNAGFSLFTNGFSNSALVGNYNLHLIIIGLMFLGTLGFIPLFDLFNFSRIRERWKYPWKQIDFSTKIAVYFSLGLIVFGAVAFFFLEYSNTLRGQTFSQAIITSVFQSITPRNIGFNTVDMKACTVPMLIIFLFLMFIGAGSASSGGGIRTSSLALLSASALATIQGKKDADLFKRTIPNDLIFKAFSVLLFFILGILVTSLLLSITEAHILAQPGRDFMDLLFETVSAFTTTGLTMGITQDLTDAGKCIAVVAMYIGRVGTLSVAYLFGRKVISTAYRYAEGYTLVG